jgi:predicted RNA-binding protein with TRAM domain
MHLFHTVRRIDREWRQCPNPEINVRWLQLVEYSMVEIPDSLRSLFTAEIEAHEDRYVIEIPESEIEHDAAAPGRTYRVAILPRYDSATTEQSSQESPQRADDDGGPPDPPVDQGEIRDVTIESVGDQGDGIAKVERGYVVIVPDAQPGDQPTVEIEQVKENVAFATILEEDSRTL